MVLQWLQIFCEGASHFNSDWISQFKLIVDLKKQVDINQCKLVVNIKKWVDINKYKYVCIKLVHACWENWQYALTHKAGPLVPMLNVCTMIGTSSLLFGTSTLAKFYIVNTEGVSIASWHFPPYEKGERRAKCGCQRAFGYLFAQ